MQMNTKPWINFVICKEPGQQCRYPVTCRDNKGLHWGIASVCQTYTPQNHSLSWRGKSDLIPVPWKTWTLKTRKSFCQGSGIGPDCPVSFRGGEKLTPTLQGSQRRELMPSVLEGCWARASQIELCWAPRKKTLWGVHLSQVLETQGAFPSPVRSHSALQHSPAQSLPLPHCHFPPSRFRF